MKTRQQSNKTVTKPPPLVLEISY